VLQLQVLSANELVTDLREMLQRLVGDRIDVRFVLDAHAGSFRADPSQVEQAVVNLAVNAKDAMPDGGTMTVRTSFVERSGATDASMSMPGGRYAVLEVSDTGVGMDPETRAHAFEPFFTTKAAGRGPGLGLATVYGIVRQSDGFIFVDSEPGDGTTFRMFFPAVEDERTEGDAALPAAPPSGAAKGGAETILLVEDEASVRGLVKRTLEGGGYRVLEAASGAQALERIRTHPETVDLLLTDVVMPGMSGRALADRIEAQYPEMQVLFISGYTDDAVVRHGVLEAEAHFLQKPFPAERLLRKVRDILGRGGAAR
jgi:two-component system cell cycle sensor histidine kinase/response regulator CckA